MLRAGDEIMTINNVLTKDLSHREAEHLIKTSGDHVALNIKRYLFSLKVDVSPVQE